MQRFKTALMALSSHRDESLYDPISRCYVNAETLINGLNEDGSLGRPVEIHGFAAYWSDTGLDDIFSQVPVFLSFRTDTPIGFQHIAIDALDRLQEIPEEKRSA